MALNWSTLKKWRFTLLGLSLCAIIIVHLEMRVAFLWESNQNDLRTLKSLEEEMENEEIRFRVVVKERSNRVNNNSRKIRTVDHEDRAVSQTLLPENTFAHSREEHTNSHTDSGIDYTDTQMFRQRLKIRNGVKELWWHLRGRLKQLAHSGVSVDGLLEDFGHQVHTVMFDMEKLESHPAIATWKNQTEKQLAKLVQKRLHYLQNPKDCKTARKLICDLTKPCGYGCVIHHIGYCFIVAYATRRTMILESQSGYFAGSKGWNNVFMPLSNTCTEATTSGAMWSAHSERELEVKMPIVEMLNPRPPQMPMAFPKDLSDKLLAFHEDPFLWWAGQIFKYLLRPNEEMEKYINTRRNGLGFKKPIVGVQVRRTDKIGTEAAFHSIEEYMVHVEEWYQQHAIATGHQVDQKRVFLATDDHRLLEEAKKKYPEYQFISDNTISQLAAEDKRYSVNSLYGVIFDITMLSQSDYLVCTFSSQVCRLAYELMQTYHIDATRYYYSLDDIYYYGGMQGHHVRMIYPQKSKSPDQLDLEVGDTISIAGNEKDGTSKGRLHRTGRYGEYLSYKAENVLRIEDFPTYKEVV